VANLPAHIAHNGFDVDSVCDVNGNKTSTRSCKLLDLSFDNRLRGYQNET
jgi:hypothetical protein